MAEKSIRNIGLFGHAGCGKTTIADALVYITGINSRFGKVAEKTSFFDTDPEEMERGCSLNIGLATFEHKNTLFSIIDTPGYSDFIGEAFSAMAAVDVAIMVVDGVNGIEVGTERLLQAIEDKKIPLIFFISKLQKENADYYKILEELGEITKRNILPLTLPVGEAQGLSAVVDIIKERAYGKEGKELKIPDEMKATVSKFKEKIVESAADSNDALMNKYLEGQEIKPEECYDSVKKGITHGQIALCLAGDALSLIGISSLIDACIELMPAPDMLPDLEVKGTMLKRSDSSPFVGYVFKTSVEPHLGELCLIKVISGKVSSGDTVLNVTREIDEKANQLLFIRGKERKEIDELRCGMIGGLVKLKDTHTGNTLASAKSKVVLPAIEFPIPSISMAIVPKAKGDEEKVSSGLTRLHDEDPSFSFAFDPEIKQLIISGIGELHLDTILSRLKRKYGVSVELAKPGIKYRETFTTKSEAQGKYKKQTGGHGQYGDCWLRVEPKTRGEGVEFVNAIVGGRIPSRYIPSVEKGVKESLQNGVLAGYPVTDVTVSVFEGSYHAVDSSDIAFKIAASMALKANAEKGNVVLLEPISEVEVFIPESYMGDVMGDLNSRRGKIMGMEGEGKIQKIKALIPEAEMYKYSTSLRSLTQGRGYFNMKFHHYEEVPKDITKKIVAESKQ